MTFFSFWCLILALAIDSYARSFKLSRSRRQLPQLGKGNPLNLNRYFQHNLMNPLCSTSLSLLDISDEVLAIIKGRNSTGSASSGLNSRPGYTFGLGCDKWEASSYSGSIEGWSSEPMIRWASRSLLKEQPYESKSIEAVDESDYTTKPSQTDMVRAVQTRLDLHFSVGSTTDVPDMRISISETVQGYSVLLDFVPRVELISSLEYFDKYFENVEGHLATLIASGISSGIATHKPSDSVLSKMLQSPFATSISVKIENGDFVRDLCMDYVNRWCVWLDNASHTATQSAENEITASSSQGLESSASQDGTTRTTDENLEMKIAKEKELKQQMLVRMYNRDQSLQKLFFEEQKYELARLMGANFAPKAAELAAAIIGPSLGASSYSLY